MRLIRGAGLFSTAPAVATVGALPRNAHTLPLPREPKAAKRARAAMTELAEAATLCLQFAQPDSDSTGGQRG